MTGPLHTMYHLCVHVLHVLQSKGTIIFTGEMGLTRIFWGGQRRVHFFQCAKRGEPELFRVKEGGP